MKFDSSEVWAVKKALKEMYEDVPQSVYSEAYDSIHLTGDGGMLVDESTFGGGRLAEMARDVLYEESGE